jgi:hypothetical protein
MTAVDKVCRFGADCRTLKCRYLHPATNAIDLTRSSTSTDANAFLDSLGLAGVPDRSEHEGGDERGQDDKRRRAKEARRQERRDRREERERRKRAPSPVHTSSSGSKRRARSPSPSRRSDEALDRRAPERVASHKRRR